MHVTGDEGHARREVRRDHWARIIHCRRRLEIDGPAGSHFVGHAVRVHGDAHGKRYRISVR